MLEPNAPQPLDAGRVEELLTLTAGIDCHLAVRSILAGLTEGMVQVDRVDGPGSVLIGHPPRFYLAGSPDLGSFNLELERILKAALAVAAEPDGPGLILIYTDRPAWPARLAEIFSGYKTIEAGRLYFETAPQLQPWRERIPPGFSLRLADRELLSDPAIMDLAALREEMCSERASVEEFLEKSFGFALLYGSELAGWCLSEYNGGGRCEVGIATLPPYQHRGLATLQTYAFMELAAQRGIERIGWHCFANNKASAATARKTGFTKICEYPVTVVWADGGR